MLSVSIAVDQVEREEELTWVKRYSRNPIMLDWLLHSLNHYRHHLLYRLISSFIIEDWEVIANSLRRAESDSCIVSAVRRWFEAIWWFLIEERAVPLVTLSLGKFERERLHLRWDSCWRRLNWNELVRRKVEFRSLRDNIESPLELYQN